MAGKKQSFWKKHKFLTGALLVLAVLAAVVIAILMYRKEEEQNLNFDLSIEDDTVPEGYTEEEHDMDSESVVEYSELTKEIFDDPGYTHYLVLGVDYSSRGYVGNRGDSIKILSVSEKQGRAILTSVPRDMYVFIEGKGYDKISHSYAYGQSKLMVEVIEANFDIDIERYFTFNFEAVRKIVDMLDGIPMYVTQAEADCMTYMFNTPGAVEGENILNGDQAIAYCRIRKIDSDVQRTQRQYKVLQQVFEKVKAISPLEYPALLAEAYPYLHTNASVAECLSLINTVIDMGIGRLENKMLFGDFNADGRMMTNLDGATRWFYVPKDLEQTMTDWRTFLGVSDYQPSSRIQYLSDYLKDTINKAEEETE